MLLEAAGLGLQGVGAILNADAVRDSNREVRRHNRKTEDLANQENRINLAEYFQNRPIQTETDKLQLEMLRKKYLQELISRYS